jgi:hypothetical protein
LAALGRRSAPGLDGGAEGSDPPPRAMRAAIAGENGLISRYGVGGLAA